MEDTTRLRVPLRRAVLGLLLAGVALAGAAPGLAQADAENRWASLARVILAEARDFAGEDTHGKAVACALAALELDPGLETEASQLLAFQLLWQERAGEAVPWFRRWLDAHPDDLAGRLGLALALSWDGDYDSSELEYRRVLDADPGNRDALEGLARLQSWREDHDAASEQYGRMLEETPSSREALVGLAAAENKRGRHRRAALLYRKILEEDPDDRTGRVGLARAHHWSGRDDLAWRELEGVSGSEADGLRREILSARMPDFDGGYSFYTDADDQDVESVWTGVEASPHPQARLRAELRRIRAEEPGVGEIRTLWVTGGGSWRPTTDLVLNAYLTIGLPDADGDVDAGAGVLATPQFIEETRTNWDTWLTWVPSDWWRFDFGYGRRPIETPKSLARRVDVDMLSVGAERNLTERLSARASVSYGDYDDGNVRNAASGEVGYETPLRIPVRVGAGASWFAFDETLDHGYYNPDRYDAFFGTIEVPLRLHDRLRVVADTRLSSEHESDSDRFGVWAGGVEATWDIQRALGLSAFARKSTSRFDTSAGYEREGWGVYLRVAP